MTQNSLTTSTAVSRRIFSWRSARWLLVGNAALATAVAAFYGIENWRGARAWAAVEQRAREAGISLRFSDVAPPSIPDSENVAATPLLAALCHKDESAEAAALARWQLRNAQGELRDLPRYPPEGSLDEWRRYLGAPDLLAYLERYRADLDEITTASRRPQSRFPVDYAKGVLANLPSMDPLMWLQHLFELRVAAYLERGDAAAAAADIVTLLRLGRALQREPLLLPQLVGCSFCEVGSRLIDAGLATRAWSELELALLADELARIDILAAGKSGFRTELALVSSFMLQAAGDPSALTKFADVSRVEAFLVPRGWVYQNAAFHARVLVERMIPAFDLERRRLDDARVREYLAGEGRRGARRYRWLAESILSHFGEIFPGLADMQRRLDRARAACALERWRLRHREYPASLAELPAAWGIAELHDVATGEPLLYQRTEDGRFTLGSSPAR